MRCYSTADLFYEAVQVIGDMMARSAAGLCVCWLCLAHFLPSSLGCPSATFLTTDTGSPVYDITSSLTVGQQGK